MIDEQLLESLYGYCYPRTRDSYAAKELCSDIVYALVEALIARGILTPPEGGIGAEGCSMEVEK
jgi:hypothetical protein